MGPLVHWPHFNVIERQISCGAMVTAYIINPMSRYTCNTVHVFQTFNKTFIRSLPCFTVPYQDNRISKHGDCRYSSSGNLWFSLNIHVNDTHTLLLLACIHACMINYVFYLHYSRFFIDKTRLIVLVKDNRN